MPELFDTHAHLDQPEFDEDRADVLRRAQEAGVATILVIGTTADSSRAAAELAAENEGVYAAVGIQPNYVGEAAEGDWQQIVELSRREKVVALGETGLDRYWDYTPFELQQDYFDRHLKLSCSSGLPVVIHSRECDEDILTMLRQADAQGGVSGVMHSFASTAATAAECLALGLHISFAGMVTYKKSDTLRNVALTIPSQRLLIETDAPYLSPVPLRGKRNEPAHVVHTAQCLAEIRGQSLEDLAAQTTENGKQLFKLS